MLYVMIHNGNTIHLDTTNGHVWGDVLNMLDVIKAEFARVWQNSVGVWFVDGATETIEGKKEHFQKCYNLEEEGFVFNEIGDDFQKTFTHPEDCGKVYHAIFGTIRPSFERIPCLKVGMSFPGTDYKPIDCAGIIIGACMPENFYQLQHMLGSGNYPVEYDRKVTATFKPLSGTGG